MATQTAPGGNVSVRFLNDWLKHALPVGARAARRILADKMSGNGKTALADRIEQIMKK